MEKVKISNNVYIPMPMTILGTKVNGNDNYMAVGWICRINANPPMLAMGIGTHHYSLEGIMENKEFSINFPGESILKQTDYVGLFSGAKTDKSTIFNSFDGSLKNAPLIKECGLNLACTLVESIKLPTNTLIIGEIKEAYCNSEFVKSNTILYKEMLAFFLTMPDNNYWSFGEPIGKAWSIGKELIIN
jgi:flavin reductase (DIM6/NTAB) family NADH-FMN oxidoreductase RutF